MQEITLDYSHYFWQGQKVRLRLRRIEDAERIFASTLDSVSQQILQVGVELPTSVDIVKAKLETDVGAKEDDRIIRFAIETLDGDYVGGLFLHSRDEKNGKFSFGVIVDCPYRRHGYAEDAVRILLRYGFWERRYQKCDSSCAHTNDASIRLHRKLGFLEEGRRRRQWFYNGEYYDEILFGLTREEFDLHEKEGKWGPHR